MFSQACVSHSVHRGRGSLSVGVFVQEESLTGRPLPRTVKSRQYASYWNAFLFFVVTAVTIGCRTHSMTTLNDGKKLLSVVVVAV